MRKPTLGITVHKLQTIALQAALRDAVIAAAAADAIDPFKFIADHFAARSSGERMARLNTELQVHSRLASCDEQVLSMK